MYRLRTVVVQILIVLSVTIGSQMAFDDFHEEPTPITTSEGHLNKDKLLFRNVKKLMFYRNRRTTSRRTHSIHQLNCVGGTAGCKLFTPNEVECEKLEFKDEKGTHDWRCHTDVGDRVTFNHVEVICEGYDYPEDDYILAGSCGLEFTLDYSNPNDYHHKSYFGHMDEHEKELHRQKNYMGSSGQKLESSKVVQLIESLAGFGMNSMFLVGLSLILIAFVLVVIKIFISTSSTKTSNSRARPFAKGSSYGPLTSALLTTKKAC